MRMENSDHVQSNQDPNGSATKIQMLHGLRCKLRTFTQNHQ